MIQHQEPLWLIRSHTRSKGEAATSKLLHAEKRAAEEPPNMRDTKLQSRRNIKKKRDEKKSRRRRRWTKEKKKEKNATLLQVKVKLNSNAKKYEITEVSRFGDHQTWTGDTLKGTTQKSQTPQK